MQSGVKVFSVWVGRIRDQNIAHQNLPVKLSDILTIAADVET